jgi:hypothetical protein
MDALPRRDTWDKPSKKGSFTPQQIPAFKKLGAQIVIGFDHSITAIWQRFPSRCAPPSPRISIKL